MTQLAELARHELDERLAEADRLQAAGKLGAVKAEAALRPWIAIAIHAGCDLADFPAVVDFTAEVALVAHRDGRAFYEDDQVRKIVAVNICPRVRWQPILIRTGARATAEAARDPARADRLATLIAQLVQPAQRKAA